MNARQSNNPKRRIAPEGHLNANRIASIPTAHPYVGSANHKINTHETSYGFQPPANPRPHKALCDDKGGVNKHRAIRLFLQGLQKSMVSQFEIDGIPKYVWSVDEDRGEVFEAKWDRQGYHGYRLSDERDATMREIILAAWNAR